MRREESRERLKPSPTQAGMQPEPVGGGGIPAREICMSGECQNRTATIILTATSLLFLF